MRAKSKHGVLFRCAEIGAQAGLAFPTTSATISVCFRLLPFASVWCKRSSGPPPAPPSDPEIESNMSDSQLKETQPLADTSDEQDTAPIDMQCQC